jgi:hypothetical protein
VAAKRQICYARYILNPIAQRCKTPPIPTLSFKNIMRSGGFGFFLLTSTCRPYEDVATHVLSILLCFGHNWNPNSARSAIPSLRAWQVGLTRGTAELALTHSGDSALAALTLCSGKLRDLTSDEDNCGSCGMACPSTTNCSNSICACPTGMAGPLLGGHTYVQAPVRRGSHTA